MSEIPRAIRALWEADDQPRRGPKPKLSVLQIAEAAMEIADADGLAGVSMASVAKRLGVTTMALYRYVDTKDTLLAVMLDAAYGPAPEIPAVPDWRTGISRWATSALAALRRHPWVVSIRLAPPPLGPNTIAWMDLGLAILTHTGLDDGPAASALLVVDGYVRNQVQMEQQYVDAATASWGDLVRDVLPPDAHPSLRHSLDAGVFDADQPDQEPFPNDQFGFGLNLILDGIDRLITS